MLKDYCEKKNIYVLLATCFLITIPFTYSKLWPIPKSLIKTSKTPEIKTTESLEAKPNEKFEIVRNFLYLFKNALSLADDVDGTHWQGDIAIQDDLFDKYGFNIGRSMFMYMPKIDTDSVTFTNQESALESDSIINWPSFENSTYYLLRRYFDGGINYIHMWSTFEKLQNQTAIIAQQHVKVTVKDKSQSVNKKIKVFKNIPSNFPGIRLYLTVNEKISDVIVQIIDRNNNTFNWCIGNVKSKSQCRWLSKLPPSEYSNTQSYFFKF